MSKRRIAIIGTASLLSIGGLTACGSSSSSTASTTASASASAPSGQPPNGGQGMGTAVTGTTATKASDAATAKYPGTVRGVMQQTDGSYVVGVETSDGMVLVQVSKAFVVTGRLDMPQGGTPPEGGTPPQGGTPPSGSAPEATSTTATS